MLVASAKFVVAVKVKLLGLGGLNSNPTGRLQLRVLEHSTLVEFLECVLLGPNCSWVYLRLVCPFDLPSASGGLMPFSHLLLHKILYALIGICRIKAPLPRVRLLLGEILSGPRFVGSTRHFAIIVSVLEQLMWHVHFILDGSIWSLVL